MTNFEVSIADRKISRLIGSHEFPFCGNFINTFSLDIKRSFEQKDPTLSNSLTVKRFVGSGPAIRQKLCKYGKVIRFTTYSSTLKLRWLPMYLDTDHNSMHTVLVNINATMIDTAMRLCAYLALLDTVSMDYLIGRVY